MGAGAIGSYVGGVLAHQGMSVSFVGRAAWAEEVRTSGISLRNMGGPRLRVPDERVRVGTDASLLARHDVVLVCVKSGHTDEAARALAAALDENALVVSLQNGVHNAEILRQHLPRQAVLAGIVSFNVMRESGSCFHRATSGEIVVEASADPRAVALVRALTGGQVPTEMSATISGQQWSKLIMNLNNAVTALSGLPLRDVLLSRPHRLIVAALMEEGLAVLRAAGIRPTRLGALPVSLFPTVLRLPTPVLRLIARAQLEVDPEARSSMWEDLERRRTTEVDCLNGEVVRLAKRIGIAAPRNACVCTLVHEAERKGRGAPNLGADTLMARMGLPPP